MFEHIHHLLAVIGAAIGGVLLIFAGRPKLNPPAPAPMPAPPTPVPEPAPFPVIKDGLTAKACMELVGFEAIVLEAYKDVKGIWTWAIGITSASGHKVERYIDNPQTVKFCLQIFIWLLRTKYLPDVLRVFRGTELSEAQLAAALSFHYNTGAIGHATWVDHWKAGDIAGAKVLFMHWDKPASIIERRQKECDLFFDGKWSSDELGLVLPVLKPSYHPNFHGAYHVAIKTALEDLLGAG